MSGKVPRSAAPVRPPRPPASGIPGAPLTTTSSKMLCSCVSICTMAPALLGARLAAGCQARAPETDRRRGGDARRNPQVVRVALRLKHSAIFCAAQPTAGPCTEAPGSARRSLITKPPETRVPARWFRRRGRAPYEADESASKRSLEPKPLRAVVEDRPPPPGWRGICCSLRTVSQPESTT